MKKVLLLSLVLSMTLLSCNTTRRYYNAKGEGELVNVGYSTTTKDDLTYSVSSLKPTEQEMNYSNMYDYLRGRVPGVIVGSGNSPSSIQVRGINSINSSTAPLILIDGIEGDLNALNPHDVYSVDVLKDASSSIYGVRGANGVIMITTKSARQQVEAEAAAKREARAARKAAKKK